MSAFMVDKEHVDLLVAVGIKGVRGRSVRPDHSWNRPSWYATDLSRLDPETVTTAMWRMERRQIDYTTADEVGAMLVATNLDSIHARYPDTIEAPEETPGPIERYWEHEYRWADPRYVPTAVEALKAISCYEYQSCEHEGWEDSEAKRYCEALRDAVIHHLPGMDDAPWDWSAETIAERRAASLVA